MLFGCAQSIYKDHVMLEISPEYLGRLYAVGDISRVNRKIICCFRYTQTIPVQKDHMLLEICPGCKKDYNICCWRDAPSIQKDHISLDIFHEYIERLYAVGDCPKYIEIPYAVGDMPRVNRMIKCCWRYAQSMLLEIYPDGIERQYSIGNIIREC